MTDRDLHEQKYNNKYFTFDNSVYLCIYNNLPILYIYINHTMLRYTQEHTVFIERCLHFHP